MMNVTRRLGVVLTSAILLAGCGPGESGSGSDMTFDAVPPSAPSGASSAPPAPVQGTAGASSSSPTISTGATDAAPQSAAVARLRGADFTIKDQPEKTGVRGDDLVVSH